MIDRRQILEQLQQTARLAGEAILAIYQQDFAVMDKADHSPLTEADLAAHQIISERLSAMTADIPVLSEESAAIDWPTRQSWSRYWLVDPLDGTKEFIKKNGEFTVNIALIEQHRATLAVVYAPVLDKLYFADLERGCWLNDKGQIRALQRLEPTTEPGQSSGAAEPIRIVGSRSHPSPDMAQYLLQYPHHQLVSVGSSLKFCLIAEGLADIYPRLGPTMEWDTGAGQCIAEAAGATVQQLDGEPLTYNNKDSLLNPYFIVR